MTIRERTIADLRAMHADLRAKRARLQCQLERLEMEREAAAYDYASMEAWLDDQASRPRYGKPRRPASLEPQ